VNVEVGTQKRTGSSDVQSSLQIVGVFLALFFRQDGRGGNSNGFSVRKFPFNGTFQVVSVQDEDEVILGRAELSGVGDLVSVEDEVLDQVGW